MSAPVSDADRSLAEPEVQECPWPYYRAVSERSIFFDAALNFYVCVDYQMMREIMRQPQRFSSVNSQNIAHMRTPPEAVRAIQAAMERPVNILVSSDPPEHGRVRSLLDPPFRSREITALRPRIESIVEDVIDRFIRGDTFDAVADFAIPIPITVIADILGLDRSYAQTIKDWSDASVEPLGMMISDERWVECAQSLREFQDFMRAELEQRQREPRDDLLTHLVQARDEHGNPLTMGEMLGVTQQLLVAGNETTTNGIAAGVQLLIENPEQQAYLREHSDRMYTFVNEVLRLESPVQGLFRITTEDVTLGGLDIPRGSRIHLRYAAANRDPRKYNDPDTLDVCRSNAGTQVGFGAGIHHCLGANLAREEMHQAFTSLLAHTAELAFAPGAAELAHHPSLVLRGLQRLDVAFRQAG